jgi:hypothetical protein
MEESRIKTQERIFVGFSSVERHEVVESILYHLANYGMAIWYDRHKMRLGDFYSENFTDGILNSKYAVIILSSNIINAKCFAEEMEYIKKQFEEGEITIFPLLYKIKPHEIPEQYEWITRLVYKELDEKSGTLLTCNHIMSRILTDELKECTHQTLYELQRNISLNKNDIFIENILQSYLQTGHENHNARIAILFCLYKYISVQYGIIEMLPQHYWRAFDRLFSYTKLHLSIDLREILILELAIMIQINKLFY